MSYREEIEVQLFAGLRALADGKARVTVRANTTGQMLEALVEAYPGLEDAIEQGLLVVIVSRTRGGRVTIYPRYEHLGLINGHDLDGLKARMLTIAALGVSDSKADLQAFFDRAAGVGQ